MSVGEKIHPLRAEDVIELLESTAKAIAARTCEELAACILTTTAKITQSSATILYVVDSRLCIPHFFQQGLSPEDAKAVEKLCAEQLMHLAEQAAWHPVFLTDPHSTKPSISLLLHPLRANNSCLGLLGHALPSTPPFIPSQVVDTFLHLLAHTLGALAERIKAERQLIHLNTYLTVSSMLAKAMDLLELLEIALYSCMEVASASDASILLLDDEKEKFYFYQVGGAAKPVLLGATFPADKGLAGHILKTQNSEVINDVQNDLRFYGKIDSDSGFTTRNMIVLPLTAGEERIGVLEVLNKADGELFTEEEHLLLLSIAEEIAFAIRNARVFDYVVNTYCKQRQGQQSCKGCKRPLGSWTPCVKYRQNTL
jgi:GAF domain-containing protein